MHRFLKNIILWSALLVPALSQAQERITVLYPSPAGSWMIPVIAKEAKYFEREGLSVEYVRVGGSTRIVAALLGGSAQIIHAGEPAIIPAVQRGADIVVIAAVLRLMTQHGINPKAADLKPEDIADMSLCKKLEDSVFFARLQ
jgi:ABC-type nitrate/sulfonate/bicarbonate transport system substrate-binding protein